MRNKELESIAIIIANRDEETTDGDCLDTVWKYLVDCGVDPDDFRFIAPETPQAFTDPVTRFEAGQELAVRSLGDYDCVFRFTVVKRTDHFVTLAYFGDFLKVRIRQWSDGVEYCYPLGTYSMAPMLKADGVLR
jgi:hypothetical protein